MAYPHRPTLPSHIRPSSGLATNLTSSSTQSSLLQTRINEKKLELENLRQLSDLSAGLAGQMQQLEEKLGTLSSGTEAVAAVMGNWGNVLRAIHMASAKIPSGKEEEGEEVLPQTLVRIPIEQADQAAAKQKAEAEAAAGE